MHLALRVGRNLLTVNTSVASQLQAPPRSDGDPISMLVVGIDKRGRTSHKYSALDPDLTEGERADAMLLVVVDPTNRQTRIITIPRALGVDLPTIGYQRIGWARQYGGASMLTAAVRDMLGIPIHHYVEFDFQGFAGVVDSLGGVDIDVATNMKDWRARLDLSSGWQRLDGLSALGLVRSRSQDVVVDSRQRKPALGDAGRSERLVDVIEALLDRLSEGMKPMKAVSAMLRTSRHVVVDQAMTERDLVQLMTTVKQSSLRFVDIAVRPSVQPKDLVSPFPPHQSSGSHYLEFEEPAASFTLHSERAVLGGGAG